MVNLTPFFNKIKRNKYEQNKNVQERKQNSRDW